jgi:alcohol dehydrogenase
VAIPVADLHCVRLPDGVDFDEAAALGCRFMTAFAAVAARGRVGPGDWPAVHGWRVGLSAVMLGKARHAKSQSRPAAGRTSRSTHSVAP